MDSVEAFQGQESKVVILSLVRSSKPNCNKPNSDVTKSIGFVACAKRFNVAVTRARSLLIVVGNAAVLSQDERWKALVDYCKHLRCFISDSSEDRTGIHNRSAAFYNMRAKNLRKSYSRAAHFRKKSSRTAVI